MEAGFRNLLKKWPASAGLLESDRPTLLLSKAGLSAAELASLCQDFIHSCGTETVSCILSIKMMHIYFRLGATTYDYRPHRGRFSRLVESDYRIANTDRAEAIIRVTSEELERFRIYLSNIERAPREVLGEAHALQIGDPDFTVLATETESQLSRNRFLEAGVRHNCLTWFTTAPLGHGGLPMWQQLGMEREDLDAETHSYIVPFYQFLASQASIERVPAIVIWTEKSLDQALNHFGSDASLIQRFYVGKEASIESS